MKTRGLFLLFPATALGLSLLITASLHARLSPAWTAIATGFAFLLYLAIIIGVYRDAVPRSRYPIFHALASGILGPFGVLVWLCIRPPRA